MKYYTNNIFATKLYEEYNFIKMYIQNLKYHIEITNGERNKLQKMIQFYKDIKFKDDNTIYFLAHPLTISNISIKSDINDSNRMLLSDPTKEYDICILSDVLKVKRDLKLYLKAFLKKESEKESKLNCLKSKLECPYENCNHGYNIYIQCSCGSKINSSGEWLQIAFRSHLQSKKHTEYCIEKNYLTFSEKQELDFLHSAISNTVKPKNGFSAFAQKLKDLKK